VVTYRAVVSPGARPNAQAVLPTTPWSGPASVARAPDPSIRTRCSLRAQASGAVELSDAGASSGRLRARPPQMATNDGTSQEIVLSGHRTRAATENGDERLETPPDARATPAADAMDACIATAVRSNRVERGRRRARMAIRSRRRSADGRMSTEPTQVEGERRDHP